MNTRGISLWQTTLLFLLASESVFALQPPNDKSDLRQKEFFLPELYISNRAASYSEVNSQLTNKGAIDAFVAEYGSGAIHFDPRSGFPMSITASIPLFPGKGVGNRLTIESVSQQLGRSVKEVNANVIAELFRNFVIKNQAALGVDVSQMGAVKAAAVNERLWHISIPQQVNGVPVRWSRYVAAINGGNIVLQGAATWGNVKIDTTPRITAHQAMELGFQYAGGRLAKDFIWKQPELELIPIAPKDFTVGESFGGPVGSGYAHRLAWVFGFQRAPEHPRWEALIDAHTAEVLAFEDKNHYIDKKITGGIYPLTNTEICPDNIRCGILQSNTPMPFTNTGFAAPNNFTNSAGVFDYTSGTTTTTLSGPYVVLSDTCGAINATGSGDIDMGGANGNHDCATPTSGGNTSASRSGMYEVNKIFETARGYLPANQWAQGNQGGPLPTNMNINSSCNAFYTLGDPGTINFYRELGGCRNTGEIAGVFDHEWGHGMDDHDTIGSLSNSSEGYADIASMYRLWASCVGYGFFNTIDNGCGMTADGTGFNQDEAQQGSAVCDLDCSGVRDADYLKITGGAPLGASFVCASCDSGTGPCGRQEHCAATATREAAWNLVARELQNPPGTDVDANTAFIIGDRVFYQGSGNIGTWHNCTCPSTSDGCNADGGYLNWLAADDDDGDLNNGTPHMLDIHAAFNTNGIACGAPAPTNSGCVGGPVTAPSATGITGDNDAVTLNWSAVTGTTQYVVYRTEGYVTDGADKCAFGKALIGTTNALTFTDTEVGNGRAYSYVIMAEGSNDACFGPASNCVTVTPQSCAGSVTLDSSGYSCNDTINIQVTDSGLVGSGTQNVTVTTGSDTETVTLNETPPNSAAFTGSINTSGSPGSSGDGTLNIVNGQTITITYNDASFCGPPQNVTATATADCVAPNISNVQAINVTEASATITWDTNELANSRATYALAPGPPSTNVDDLNNYVLAHSVPITGLNQCSDYVYSVTSSDIAGNPVTDNSGGSFYEFTTVGIGTLFLDDAESGIGNWTSAGTPANNQWHVSTCDSQSGTQSFKAGPVACGAQYANNASVTLTSNVTYNIEVGSRLQYMENYVTEAGFDFCTVQISTNGGSSWITIDSFDGDSGGWQQADYDLSAYAGTGRLLRFRFTTDVSVTATGWLVDDITVTRPAPCAAALQHTSEAVTDDCSSGGAGDGNGAIDPGETGSMILTAENFGVVGATNVSAVVTTTTPGVAITIGNTTFPNIPAESTAQANSAVTFVLGPGVVCGTFIVFQVAYTSNEGNFNDNFTVVVGTEQSVTLLNENFTSGIPGTWTVVNGGSGGGTAATWTTANPGGRSIGAPFTAPFAIVDSDFAGLSATQNEELITPSLDASACSTVGLTFSNQFRWYLFGDDEQGDVDVSTDGGSTWNNVLNMQDADDGYPTPNTKALDLTSVAAGQSDVRIRFHYFQGAFDWWWAIDNVQVTCLGNPTCINCEGSCLTITLSPPTLPNGNAGTPYNQTITASGGTGPYTFTVSSGAIPQGLTLSPGGVLSGTPTTAEVANFTITATDSLGCTGSLAYSITIVASTCMFCDEFDDSTLSALWTYIKSILNWSEDGTALIGMHTKKTQAHAIPVFAGCTNCQAETIMRSAGGAFNRVWFLFHVVDKDNLVELLMKEENDKWVLKHRINKAVVVKQKFLATIDPNTDYTVSIRFDGTNFIAAINGVDQITLAPGGAVTGGSVGFKVKATTGTFQRIEVN